MRQRGKKDRVVRTPVHTAAALRPALSSFVGRRDELARLRALLSASRLISITGPGGAGKTRLAEEFAASLARSFNGSIAVAYLAGTAAPSDVVEIVAEAVELRHMGARPVEAELIDYLGTKRLLLVLDNCEQVADLAAELTAELLRACPGLVIVATGRRPLHVPGEQVFPIGGLSPDLAGDLFLDRARLAAPDFMLDEMSGPLVRDICRRLDGMPLAIELAAVQVRSMGLARLSAQLAANLPELASRSTVAPARHRTLRGAIGWSYDLLSEEQRIVWRRLSVFAGGFTLEAAEEVVGGDRIEPAAIPGVLSDLVDQSMIIFEAASDRYRLLEALREFAYEQLRRADEEALVAERHRRWMVGLAVDSDMRWFSADQAAVIDRMHAEAGNLRAALEHCANTGASADGLRLANGALWYWLTRASLEEGLRWFRRFLGRSGDSLLEARAHWRAGYLATIHLDLPDARALINGALEYAAVANDPLDRAYACAVLGLETLYERPADADEARRMCRDTIEDPAADAMARQWGLIGYALASLALGDIEECRRASLEGAEIGRTVGELWGRELSLRFLAHADWQLGRSAAAEAALVECLGLDRLLGDTWHLAWSTEAIGWVATDTGRFERGARLLGIADRLWAQTGSRLAEPWQAWHATALERLGEHLGSRRVDAQLEAGRKLTRAEGLAFAMGEAAISLRPADAFDQPLSGRELEVAALVAAGLANRAIAEKLFLSPRTVEKHVEHVMDKLGVGSRAEIATWHARTGAKIKLDGNA
jgi:predicted ATPase/DNA-binding CsgD family transcriptional regulator